MDSQRQHTDSEHHSHGARGLVVGPQTVHLETPGSIPAAHPTTSMKDFYWIAGLLEGEGSFICGPPSNPNIPRITCHMCDEDVVRRVANILQAYMSPPMTPKNPNHSISWRVTLRGARARQWMALLRPLMGTRRQAQIDKALASFDPTKSRVKLTIADVTRIRALLSEGHTQQSIADEFGVHRAHISNIKRGKSWAGFTEPSGSDAAGLKESTASVAQFSVERRCEVPGVGGSIPSRGTKLKI